MQCPRCQQQNPREANFCLKCAMLLKEVSSLDANLKEELENLRRALRDTLDHQTATSEILRVISRTRPHDPPSLLQRAHEVIQ
jgi:predicted amidophosphoribosyltransferase